MAAKSSLGGRWMRWVWLWRAAWCAAMAVVTVLALMPLEHLHLPIFDWWDKAQHAVAFAALTGGVLLAWPGRPWRAGLGMLVYGGLIELAQLATGWRFAEWADLAADAVGVLLGLMVFGACRWGFRIHRGADAAMP